jgi:hypothetical protein
MAGMRSEPDGGRSVLIFVSFLVYGIVAPGLLGVSSLLAGDRVQKIVEYKRALPAPYGSQVVAKLLMAIALSLAVIVLLIGLGATLGHVPLNASQFVATGTIVLAGVLPVSAIGSYLATRAAPSGVSPIAGALLVGMAFLGGWFYPLPGVLSTLRPRWPTYHLQQRGGRADDVHRHHVVGAVHVAVEVGLHPHPLADRILIAEDRLRDPVLDDDLIQFEYLDLGCDRRFGRGCAGRCDGECGQSGYDERKRASAHLSHEPSLES